MWYIGGIFLERDVMPTAKVTIERIKKLPEGQTLWDIELKGFGCKNNKGCKSFLLKYRSGKGRTARQHLYTIGKLGAPWTPETARREAIRLLGRIADGENPSQDRKNQMNIKTVDQAFTLYMEEGAGKKKQSTLKEYQRIYDRFIKNAFSKFRITDVVEKDVSALHVSLSSTPYQANRLVQMLKAFFNWCEKKKLRSKHTNPCIDIERYPEKPCERYLSDSELLRLGEALDNYERDNKYKNTTRKNQSPDTQIENTMMPYIAAAIRLLIFTGARRDEILTLKWSDIDFDRRTIRLQESKTGQKNIYLSPPALDVLNKIPRITGNPYVICGRNDGEHLKNIKDAWGRIRKQAGLQDVRIHDLRHSYASKAVTSGKHMKVIQSLLSHSSIKTTERYAHLSEDPVQTANDQIGSDIANAMTRPKKQNVIKL